MMQNNVLDCKIFSISNLIFDKQIISVEFNTITDGYICISPGHENMSFLLTPGKINIVLKTSVKILLNDFGFAEICDNQLIIFAFPIKTENF